tara:strand:+ start:97 stop:1038 length:942 start_codon:yes stop_codon:yes gene_type:complete
MQHAHSKQISKIIFIDGMPRAGKSVLSNILPCYKEVEQIRFLTIIEHILPALRFKTIKKDFAKSLMTTYLNEYCYESYIGRTLNLRKKEQSSVYEYISPEIYFKRLKKKEGTKTINEIKKKKNYFLFQTHDVISNYRYFLKLNIDCKIIEVIRNPIDIIFSWYKRGWGKRFTKDPQSFTSLVKKKNILTPWYAFTKPKYWQQLNEVERCAFNVFNLLKFSYPILKKIKKKNDKILIIKFENFVQSPKKEILRIKLFLKRNYSKKIFEKLKKANCPRRLNIELLNNKKYFLKKRLNTEMYKKLISFEKRYNEYF